MNDLVNNIAEGRAVLLSADDICSRLSVSRSTFDRWVRNGAPLTLKEVLQDRSPVGFPNLVADQEEGKISFPPPDIRIGNSPRWSLSTFKAWLTRNLVAGS